MATAEPFRGMRLNMHCLVSFEAMLSIIYRTSSEMPALRSLNMATSRLATLNAIRISEKAEVVRQILRKEKIFVQSICLDINTPWKSSVSAFLMLGYL